MMNTLPLPPATSEDKCLCTTPNWRDCDCELARESRPYELPPETVERILAIYHDGHYGTVAEIAKKAGVKFMDAVRVIHPSPLSHE